MRPIFLGFFYFAVVFVAGIIFGVLRTILVEPQLGVTPALLLEIPVILAISWVAAGRILTLGFEATTTLLERGLVGVTGFVMLVSAECLLGYFLFDYSFAEIVDRFSSRNGIMGLAAQVVFALFPLIRKSYRR